MINKKKIGEVCLVGDGVHASIKRVEDGVPYLTSKNFTVSGLNLNNVDFISMQDFERHFKLNSKALTKPKADDLIFSIIGSIGGAYLYMQDDNFGLSSSVAIIRPDKYEIDSEYLLYYLKSEYLQKWVEAFKSGSAQGFLSLAMIRSLPLNYPDLPTQKKIANILSAYDELIENNTQRIKLLEEMAEEIYREWFVRLRFPGYQNCRYFTKEGKEVPHGTVGALPEGWEVKTLRECLSHYIGGGWGEEFPKGKNIKPAHVLRGTDIPKFNSGELNFDVKRYHSESNLASRICQSGDIIFEVSGGTEDQSLGRTSFISQAVLDKFDAPLIGASFCKLLRVNSELISPIYVSCLLKSMYATNELKVFQVQSTGISNYQFEDFINATKVKVPSKAVINKFDSLISPMLNEIQFLGAKNQVLQETRDLLLPRLISGKLKVAAQYPNEEMPMDIAAETQAEYSLGKR